MRGATTTSDRSNPSPIFQSTRPMRGATHPVQFPVEGHGISIHAPHAGRDVLTVNAFTCATDNFNPRAPCGARPSVYFTRWTILWISIHAPHAGRDDSGGGHETAIIRFQSTRPMRGATKISSYIKPGEDISIHAPHAGRDPVFPAVRQCCTDFNPRAPCGARPRRSGLCRSRRDFNPRAPCGARLQEDTLSIDRYTFQSTRPMRGATGSLKVSVWVTGFQSTRPMRGATCFKLS